MDHFYLPPEVVQVRPLDGRSVWLEYADGTGGEVDLAPLLLGPIFAWARTDDAHFAQVKIDPMGTLCWPDGADISPERLYEQARASLRVLA